VAIGLLVLLTMAATTSDAGAVVSRSVPPAIPAEMVRVGPGTFTPLYPPSPTQTTVRVEAFLLDRRPVTNEAFRAFVEQETRWRRDRISPLFADARYLAHWEGPTKLGPRALPDHPVVHVSWFAAKAYCERQGKRLPTENEWELAALADETSPDAHESPAWTQRILEWYARSTASTLRPVGLSPPNYWGVFDLHGLVWEWVLDFNSTIVSSDSRENGESDRLRFCGSAALQASGAKTDYANFMRVAFRSSLEARFTTGTLGFRCAANWQEVAR
jgi:formylglycine-generating enzyme required for sulfatase activity